MKTKALCLLIAGIIFLMPVVSYSGGIHSVNNGSLTARNVSNFTGISCHGDFKVSVKTGAKESVYLKASDADLSKIETVVENGILKIRNKKGFRFNARSGKVNVFVTVKKLHKLDVNGAGLINFQTILQTENLQTRVNGSGQIFLSAAVQKLNALISGSGQILISGTANLANVVVSGSGNFKGLNLKTKIANVKLLGSGEANINSENEINAVLSGSGNIYYTGNAKMNQTVYGRGNISKVNFYAMRN